MCCIALSSAALRYCYQSSESKNFLVSRETIAGGFTGELAQNEARSAAWDPFAASSFNKLPENQLLSWRQHGFKSYRDAKVVFPTSIPTIALEVVPPAFLQTPGQPAHPSIPAAPGGCPLPKKY
jgi:hypothetical protein